MNSPYNSGAGYGSGSQDPRNSPYGTGTGSSASGDNQYGGYSTPLDLSGSSDQKRSNYGGSTYGGPNQGPPGQGGGYNNDVNSPQYGQPAPTYMDIGNYKFSPAENQIVKECSRESFWYRSVPMATALSTMAYLAVKQGTLKAHPKYGALVKVGIASVAGYILGKLSYVRACEDKFLRLSDSRVGDAIRRRRQGISALPPASPAGDNYGWQQPPLEGGAISPRGGSPSSTSPSPSRGGPSRRYDFPAQTAPSAASLPRNEPSSGFNTDDYVSSLDIDSEKNRYYEPSDESRTSSLDVDLDHIPGTAADGIRDRDARNAAAAGSTNYDDLRRQHRDAYFRPPQQQQPRQGGPPQ